MLTSIDRKIRAAISPSDISVRTSFDLCDTFDKTEREVSAFFIIKLAQQKGERIWFPFTQGELDAMDPAGSYAWNGLDRPEWIHRNDDGSFEVRGAFIVRALGLHREPRNDGGYLA